MSKVLLLAIPEFLNGMWYLYHAALAAVVIVSAILLRLMKKETKLQKARKNLKTALQVLRKATQSKNIANLKLRVLTALNLLKSAEYYFEGHIADTDQYSLVSAKERLSALIKDMQENPVENATDFSARAVKCIAEIESIMSEVI